MNKILANPVARFIVTLASFYGADEVVMFLFFDTHITTTPAILGAGAAMAIAAVYASTYNSEDEQ